MDLSFTNPEQKAVATNRIDLPIFCSRSNFSTFKVLFTSRKLEQR